MIQVCLSLCNWISDHDDNNNQWIDASRIRKKKKNRLSISQVRWWNVIFFSSSSLIVSDTRQFLLLLLVFFLFHTIQLETILNASLSYEQFIEREEEGENDRLTGSILFVVYSCHGYWSMRTDRWNNVHEKRRTYVQRVCSFSLHCRRSFLPLTLIGATIVVLVSWCMYHLLYITFTIKCK